MNQDVSPSKPKTPELNRFSIVSSSDEEEKKLPTIVSDESEEEETLNVTIPKFPIQAICMENCENTLDDLILNDELKEPEEWFSALMQIIMILII